MSDRVFAPVLFSLFTLLCTSCGSTQPSRFYLLTPEAGASARAESVSLIVGPINFPVYLDRSEMVIRRGGELELLSFERWGEPLPSNFRSVLVADLAERTGSDRIYSFRWPGSVSADYRLTGSISRFEVDASGLATLEIQWRLSDAEGAAVVPTRRSRFTESSEPGDFADMAAALSRTVAAFSDEVSRELAGL